MKLFAASILVLLSAAQGAYNDPVLCSTDADCAGTTCLSPYPNAPEWEYKICCEPEQEVFDEETSTTVCQPTTPWNPSVKKRAVAGAVCNVQSDCAGESTICAHRTYIAEAPWYETKVCCFGGVGGAVQDPETGVYVCKGQEEYAGCFNDEMCGQPGDFMECHNREGRPAYCFKRGIEDPFE